MSFLGFVIAYECFCLLRTLYAVYYSVLFFPLHFYYVHLCFIHVKQDFFFKRNKLKKTRLDDYFCFESLLNSRTVDERLNLFLCTSSST